MSVLHIDVNVRMCQEQWNHGGSMAITTSAVQQGPPHGILPHVNLEARILFDQLSQLLSISILNSSQHERERRRSQKKENKKEREKEEEKKEKRKTTDVVFFFLYIHKILKVQR